MEAADLNGMNKIENARKRDNMLTAGVLTVIQLVVLVGLGNFTYYTGVHAHEYAYFRDVNIMIFFGFGFLMTFLHKHGFSAIGYCLVISALVVEMSLVVEYVVNKGSSHKKVDGRYPITIESLLNSLFCAGTVMISFGAVLGKVSPIQLIVMAVVEVFGFWINFRFSITENQAHDVGGGMVIHMFGAYFGLAATAIVSRGMKLKPTHPNERSSYNSDIFSLAGTVFLWVLWPSFQSAVAGSEQRQMLAITNTFLSLCSSTLAFAVFSRVFNNGKFSVVHMQNATLAGGVVMGVAGDMDIGLHGAGMAGFAAGFLSCLGYSFISPQLEKIGIHDTCGVNNLHGMPGIMGSILAVIATAKLGNGKDLGTREIRGFRSSTHPNHGITALQQMWAMLITLGVSLALGVLAGAFMKVCEKLGAGVSNTDLFNDRLFFGDEEEGLDKTETNVVAVVPCDSKAIGA